MVPFCTSVLSRQWQRTGCFVFFLPLLAVVHPVLATAAPPDSSHLDSLLTMDIVQLVNLEVAVATATPKPIKLAPAVASVITAEEIRRMGATTLDEVLTTVPGLHVYPNGTNIFQSNWSIRGIQSGLNPHVLLLINGAPLVSAQNGHRPYGLQIPVSMISRIEIMRGPGSAVHGADAFAGTVNVITGKGSETAGSEVGGRYGSFATRNLWGRHGGVYDGWDLNFGVDWRKSSGDKDRIIVRDGLGSGLPSHAPGPLDTHQEIVSTILGVEKGRWTADLFSSFARQGMGHSGLQVLSEDSEIKTALVEGDVQYEYPDIVTGLDVLLRGFAVFNDGENYFDFYPNSYGVNAIGNPQYTGLQGGTEAATVYHGTDGHRFRSALGLVAYNAATDQYKNFGPGVPPDHLYQEPVSLKNTPYIYLEDQNRTVWYGSVQDEWSLAENWELTAGVRYDHYSDFGGTTNPRIALVWETTEVLTTKLMYGSAFRPPAFGEQYFKNNPLSLGNPDIGPETIDTYELALQYQPTKKLNLQANFYLYEIEDLIEYVPDPPPALTKTAQNYTDLEGRGVEVALDWQVLDDLLLKASIAYQRSEDADSGEPVAEAPAWDGYVNAHWTFLPDWSLDGQYFLTAERQRANSDIRPEVDDYQYVNLTLRREHLFGNWEAAMAVRNLFDEDVLEPSPAPGLIPGDYPMESRAFWLEVRCTF
ncbi:MAG: TonB-dependent receptor [Desulfobulbus sp.]|nr:MAG: TonB-dependent receptor [Desulfobulbus sp.]